MPKTMRDNLDPVQRSLLEDQTLPQEVRGALFVVWTRCYNTKLMAEQREVASVIDQLLALHKEIPKLVEKLRAQG
jgi:hypothetical protein